MLIFRKFELVVRFKAKGWPPTCTHRIYSIDRGYNIPDISLFRMRPEATRRRLNDGQSKILSTFTNT